MVENDENLGNSRISRVDIRKTTSSDLGREVRLERGISDSENVSEMARQGRIFQGKSAGRGTTTSSELFSSGGVPHLALLPKLADLSELYKYREELSVILKNIMAEADSGAQGKAYELSMLKQVLEWLTLGEE